MIFTRGRSFDHWALKVDLERPQIDFPWWRVTLQAGPWWFSVAQGQRRDLRAQRETR